MNRNFLKIIFVVTLFVGMFFGGESVKAADCCILTAKPFKNDPNIKTLTLSDCSQKLATENCSDRSTGISGVYGCVGPYGQAQLQMKNAGCVDGEQYTISFEQVDCNAYSSCKLTDCSGLKTPTDCKKLEALCFYSTNRQKCLSRNDVNQCPGLGKDDCKGLEKAGCKWEGTDTDGQCKTPLGQEIGKQYEYDASKYPLFQSCAIDGSCRSLSNILYTILKIVDLIFKYIGAIAFIFFIFGGFTMILSFGNSEKFKKGQQILVAAVVGLIIVFGAYLMVTFLVDALGIGAEFKVLK